MEIRRRRTLMCALTLLVAIGVAASATGEGNPLIGDVANGTRLYRANCTVCHGFTGAGDGPGKATLKTVPADHRDGSLMNARDDRILFDTVQLGCAKRDCSKTMPGFSGGLDARILESGDRELIRRGVTDFVRGMKERGARFVYGSDHSLSTNIDYGDFLYSLEVYREHMAY